MRLHTDQSDSPLSHMNKDLLSRNNTEYPIDTPEGWDESNIRTTGDESGTKISPLSFALTSEKANTTEAVSAGRCTTQGHLNYGSNELEDLESDGEWTDDDDDDGYDYFDPESESEKGKEKEDDDNHEGKGEDDGEEGQREESSSSSSPDFETDFESDEDAQAAYARMRHLTSIYQGVTPIPNVSLAVPERLGRIVAYFGYRRQESLREFLRKEDRGRGNARSGADGARGTKRGSDDKDEDDERACKVQRRL